MDVEDFYNMMYKLDQVERVEDFCNYMSEFFHLKALK